MDPPNQPRLFSSLPYRFTPNKRTVSTKESVKSKTSLIKKTLLRDRESLLVVLFVEFRIYFSKSISTLAKIFRSVCLRNNTHSVTHPCKHVLKSMRMTLGTTRHDSNRVTFLLVYLRFRHPQDSGLRTQKSEKRSRWTNLVFEAGSMRENRSDVLSLRDT